MFYSVLEKLQTPINPAVERHDSVGGAWYDEGFRVDAQLFELLGKGQGFWREQVELGDGHPSLGQVTKQRVGGLVGAGIPFLVVAFAREVHVPVVDEPTCGEPGSRLGGGLPDVVSGGGVVDDGDEGEERHGRGVGVWDGEGGFRRREDGRGVGGGDGGDDGQVGARGGATDGDAVYVNEAQLGGRSTPSGPSRWRLRRLRGRGAQGRGRSRRRRRRSGLLLGSVVDIVYKGHGIC